MFILLAATHFFGCLFHGLALIEINVQKSEETWLHAKELVDTPYYIRYIYSVYFIAVTMSSVGYGDILPNNYIENVFMTITIYSVSMIFAYSISAIGIIIHNMNSKVKVY